MTESQISFLYKAAHSLPQAQNRNLTLLRSYYLTRCKEITKGYGLPEKQFSAKVRCSHCCIEWRKGTQTKVRSIKLSKKQRQRIRSKKNTKMNKDYIKSRKELLNSNEMEQICSFCKQSTITPVLKPEKEKIKPQQVEEKIVEIPKDKSNKKVGKKETPKINEVNVYSNAKDIFSLKNKKNNLPTIVKERPKINNSKKKKDKFAGLCQKAVLASAKLKDADNKKNKLNLFLKRSL